jgi:hypothetical protein
MSLLDEKALRRADFQGGIGLRLADGQTWFVPKPHPVLFPKFIRPELTEKQRFMGIHPEPEVKLCSGMVFGNAIGGEDSYTVDLDAMQDDGLEPMELIRLRFEAIAAILQMNYDLTNEHLAKLLELRSNDPQSSERWLAICRCLAGTLPEEGDQTTPEEAGQKPPEELAKPPEEPSVVTSEA